MNPEGRQVVGDRRGRAPLWPEGVPYGRAGPVCWRLPWRRDPRRCSNIPARYCTGDLSDIEVPPLQTAMDVHAWFEACLGAGWPMFDPRHTMPRIRRILIARGRDAADVAPTTTCGPLELESFQVWTA